MRDPRHGAHARTSSTELTEAVCSFLSFRSTYSHHPRKRPRFTGPYFSTDEDRRGLLSSAPDDDDAGDTVIEMDLLPPRWADVTDSVGEQLGEVARASARLDRLHQKHVLPGFDDRDRGVEEGEIERLTTEITQRFHRCQSEISKIERMLRNATSAEQTMARNLQVSLATRVQASSTQFRKKQSAYLKSACDLSLDGKAVGVMVEPNGLI